jgi:hypothetical protein
LVEGVKTPEGPTDDFAFGQERSPRPEATIPAIGPIVAQGEHVASWNDGI